MAETLNPATISTSVMMFRLRAQRLLYVWARMWMNHVQHEPLGHEYVELLATSIQVAYWKVLKRNPTVKEWVRDILYYDEHPSARSNIENELRTRPVSDDPLNLLKPWCLRFQAAGRDEQKALQTFSEDVGRAFLAATGKDVVLSPDADWTDELNIEDFLLNLPKPLTTKPFWLFWKTMK